MNESSSAVRTGTGAARQNLRDLVRGLYDAGGSGPAVKGAVFIVGVGQSALSLSTYKGTLQLWYADTAFWTDMNSYVSDWSQELYGDIRNYAVPGADVTTRRDELNAWLQHPLALANAGPPEIAGARAFLQSAYSPLANAVWRYPTGAGFGWTDVPYEQMQDYVSAQTYALGSAGARFGFAWSPNRPDGVGITQFATESSAVADRLAAAIHDPASACAASCTSAIPGAAFNEGWKDFANWATPTLAFGNTPATLTAGAASAALTVRLQVAGVTRPDTVPVTVSLSSDSPDGTFSTSASGPWSATLDVPVPVGSTDALFYYRDTKAGVATIGASAPGRAGAEQVVTVRPGALATLRVTPASVTLKPGATQRFAASGADAYGNALAPSVAWSASSGTLSPVTGSATTFTPGRPGTTKITATSGKSDGPGECEGEGHAGSPRHPDHVCEERESPTRFSRRRRLSAPSCCTRLGAPRAETRRALGRVRNRSHELARARDRDENGETWLLLGEARARRDARPRLESRYAEERLLRDLSARSICRSASRFAMSRRLSCRSLPRASATSTFTLPSLK